MVHYVTGKVNRMYVNKLGLDVRLDIDPKTAPKDGYFFLRVTHPNYNALYSLALAAAVNRLPLSIRTVGEIEDATKAEKRPEVEYFVQDWAPGQDGPE